MIFGSLGEAVGGSLNFKAKLPELMQHYLEFQTEFAAAVKGSEEPIDVL